MEQVYLESCLMKEHDQLISHCQYHGYTDDA